MNKLPIICIFMLFLLTIGCKFSCKDDNFSIEFDDQASLLDYSELSGKWMLKYPQNYGYEFIFSDDYSAEITLYLNTTIIRFRGRFLLEDGSRIRITVLEMMQRDEIAVHEKNYNFMPVNNSYFLFRGQILKDSKHRTLVLNPMRIITEGKDSEGFFEPQIRLRKQ